MEKTIDTIYEEMLAVFGETSGYLPSPSCDLAARLYAAAAQLHALYLQAQWDALKLRFRIPSSRSHCRHCRLFMPGRCGPPNMDGCW